MTVHTYLCKSSTVLGLKQNALKESCLNLYSNVLPYITLTKLQHFGEQPYMILFYYFLWLCSPARAMASLSHEVSLSQTTTRHSRQNSSWTSGQLVAETST
jgi:hypothetical protein